MSTRGGAKTATGSRAGSLPGAGTASVQGAGAQEAAGGAAPPGKGGGAYSASALQRLRGRNYSSGDAEAKSGGALEARAPAQSPLGANPPKPADARTAGEGGQSRQTPRGAQNQTEGRGALATSAGKEAPAAGAAAEGRRARAAMQEFAGRGENRGNQDEPGECLRGTQGEKRGSGAKSAREERESQTDAK